MWSFVVVYGRVRIHIELGVTNIDVSTGIKIRAQ